MDNNNRGAIFKNKFKEPGDKSPDYKGTCIVEGINKEIGCWVNEDKNGQKYFSVVFSDPFAKKDQPKPSPEAWPENNEQLPF